MSRIRTPDRLRTARPAALLALAAGLTAFTARAEIKDRIAAVVNGQPITLSEVTDRVQPELQRLTHSGITGAGLEKARLDWLKRGLEQLVDDRLIESEANALGLEVSDEEVMRQVEALAKQNNLELSSFKEALASQGIDYDNVKDSLRRQALQFRLLQYKVKPRKVSDEEVQAAYAAQNIEPDYELKIRNLYVALPEGASAEQQKAAEDKVALAMERLAKGEVFAVVARDLSAAPSAHEGGDLGWIKKGSLFAEADAALFALKPGQNTALLRNSSGYHLFHLDERRALPFRPLSEMQEEIRARLANDSIAKERENYLRSLRKSAQVDLKL